MSNLSLKINGEVKQVDADPDMPLLWLLRDVIGLTGTKYGCGIGQCGCCTIHLNGVAVRSCQLPSRSVQGMEVTTIEGLATDGQLHSIQEAWAKENVPQCGYCQSGQMMSAAALLANGRRISNEMIDASMSGNLCRCGTYKRIRKAILRAANASGKEVE